MPPVDQILRAWWPTTQSMDLVEGGMEETAEAVLRAYQDIAASVSDHNLEAEEGTTLTWHDCPNLDTAFRLAGNFDNGGTKVVILPTRSRWSVLWVNSFLCDGFDSLCQYLTRNAAMRTIHWSAHDTWTTFQSGSLFHLRSPTGSGSFAERYVQTAQCDKRWSFHEYGEPLPEENLTGYGARRKRDRLNEVELMSLLERLGARPWDPGFYEVPGRVALVTRPRSPFHIVRSAAEVLAPPVA